MWLTTITQNVLENTDRAGNRLSNRGVPCDRSHLLRHFSFISDTQAEIRLNVVVCAPSSTPGIWRDLQTMRQFQQAAVLFVGFLQWADVVYFCEISEKSLFSLIWKLLAIMAHRCYSEIKDHFKSTIAKIGICSPLWALEFEIPYCLNNPLQKLNFHLAHITSHFIWVTNVLYPSSSNQQCCSTNTPSISWHAGAFKLVKFSIDPYQWQHWGLENRRLLPGCYCTFSYLRLIVAGASEKVDFSWSRDSQSSQKLCLLWSLLYPIEVCNPWFFPYDVWVKSYKICSDKKHSSVSFSILESHKKSR